MTRIQNPQLHVLIRSHVRHESHPNSFQFRPPQREAIFQDPLNVIFTKNWPSVLKAKLLPQDRSFPIRSHRCNAIYHSIGKGNLTLNPGGQFGILHFSQANHSVTSDIAVVQQIIAGHHGKGCNASCQTGTQPSQNQPKGCDRCLWICCILF